MKKYTDRERAGIANAFKRAKKDLWSGKGLMRGKENYICYAIRKLPLDFSTIEAREIVMARIYPHISTAKWLEAQGVPKEDMTLESLQIYRHQWLDLLIKEFT